MEGVIMARIISDKAIRAMNKLHYFGSIEFFLADKLRQDSWFKASSAL
tara:strand:- start:95 stop:238 length:144 start_codon:yes stop_codon:yes gene_type:complete